MRKNHELRIDRNKLLTMSIAAIFLASATTVMSTQKAFADPPNTVSAGSGAGSFFLTLHRYPQPYWPPCFASECYVLADNGTAILVKGTGTWMTFIVYDSAGNEVIQPSFANEDGTLITGLNVGETYRIVPLDFNTTGGPELAPHKVLFNNWVDCNSPDKFVQERSFTITSAATVRDGAYYRYVPAGSPENNPLPCYTGVVDKVAPKPHTHSSHHVNVDMADVYSVLNIKQAVVNSIMANSNGTVTNVAAIDGQASTTLSAKMSPDVNLSGTPLGPSGVVLYYNSLYDIQNSDSDGLVNAMKTAEILGIDWNSLSDMQKAYLTVTLEYNMPTAQMIPSTNLSGVPLGQGGQKITYNSLYDVQNADSQGIIKAMLAAEQLGVDWNSLSDMQKAYLALTLDYGAPSAQA